MPVAETAESTLTWTRGAVEALRRPGVVLRRLRIIALNARFRRERIAWLAGLTGAAPDELMGYIREIKRDRSFLSHVITAYRQHTRYLPLPTDFMLQPGGGTLFFHCVSLYALVCAVKPESIVETGGTPGKSSAFLLRALERNGRGRLYTIDMPPPITEQAIRPADPHTQRPSGLTSNWCVPDGLRSRQTLLVGRAETLLPETLAKLGRVDVFIHDSDHSYAHMRFELDAAFPFVRSGGYLWADDIQTNAAWPEFCTRRGLISAAFGGQGVVRKP